MEVRGWHFLRRWCVHLFGRRAINTTGATSPTSASNLAHPMLFHVPVVSRIVGRDTELFSLWQNLLLGRRVQAIVGPDGIGKSTIAAEFCDRARRSGRFTCIQWFNAGSALRSELLSFFYSMRGRKEKDVLLVIDDAKDVEELLTYIPEHVNVYTLLTTSADVDTSTRVSVLKTAPLSSGIAEEFLSCFDAEYLTLFALRDVFSALGYVPLLMCIAGRLVEDSAISPEKLKKVLQINGIDGTKPLSISHAIDVLLGVILDLLEARRPGSTRILMAIAFFDIGSVSYGVVDCLTGNEEGENFAVEAAALGICSQRWDEASLTLHSAFAQNLRRKADDSTLADCARALLSLWPRRWRGAGGSVARELTRHTRAICENSDALKLSINNDLLVCLDRSATLLALNEGNELQTAAELWLRVVRANQVTNRRDEEAVRISRECGRVLHFLCDDRASEVLRYAFDLSCAVYGKQSPETALILGCYAPYLSASRDAVQLLEAGVASLENRLASADTVLGKEEERMLLETVFVLLVRQGQILEEMGEKVPVTIWKFLQDVEERLK